jgi:hypothetical protein
MPSASASRRGERLLKLAGEPGARIRADSDVATRAGAVRVAPDAPCAVVR